MRLRVFLALLPLALAACAPAAPPAHGPSTGTEDVPPVLGLLAERERLALEPRQVEAIESIAREWETRDHALRREIGAAKGRKPSPLRFTMPRQARKTAEALVENNLRAAHAVGRVLHPDQRARMCTVQRLRQEVSAVPRRVKGAAPSAHARPASFARGSRDPARVWPWCASTPSHPRAGSPN